MAYRFDSCPDYQVNHTKTTNVVTAWKDTRLMHQSHVDIKTSYSDLPVRALNGIRTNRFK